MIKSKRLEPIYKFSESRQQEAARRVGESNQRLAAQRKQMDELLRYRTEYLEQLQSHQFKPQGAVRVQDFRTFMAKLDQAIEIQGRRIVVAQQEVEATRKYWMESRTHQRALGEVMDRHRMREKALDERKEQTDCDELAVRAMLKRESI